MKTSAAKQSLLRLAGVLAAGLILTGCSSLNPFASDAAKPAALVDFSPRAELKLRWQAEVGEAGSAVFEPAVVGDSVYVASGKGRLLRLDGGQQRWRADAGRELSAGVGASHSIVVVVTRSGEALAYDADSGEERWRSKIGAEVLATPVVDGDLVVLRASDNRLIGLSARDGSQRWIYQRANPPLALRNFAGVVIDEGVVLAGFPGGRLVVVDASNGAPITELPVSNPRGATELERVADVVGLPVAGRREICAVSYQGRAACFDTGNGNVLWARDFSSSVGMDRDARYAVVTDESNAVHALDVYSGSTVWVQDQLVRRAVTRPLIVDDYIAVGDLEGYVHLLDRDSGEFVARVRADKEALVAPPRAYGRGLIVQGLSGRVSVYDVR
ncbi:MAG: outer membrane protein assembly factor BamB [Thauera sp.]|jgi:outer membrane protein assembly factor BamB|nr:outer membrane protein assembly factor BamB [Thauera sp.]